jgi:hypothetical protein
VPTQTPAFHNGVFSWYTPGQIKIQSPGLAAFTADCTVTYSLVVVLGQARVLSLQTRSTLGVWPAGWPASAWPPARAAAPDTASVTAVRTCKDLRIDLSHRRRGLLRGLAEYNPASPE